MAKTSLGKTFQRKFLLFDYWDVQAVLPSVLVE